MPVHFNYTLKKHGDVERQFFARDDQEAFDRVKKFLGITDQLTEESFRGAGGSALLKGTVNGRGPVQIFPALQDSGWLPAHRIIIEMMPEASPSCLETLAEIFARGAKVPKKAIPELQQALRARMTKPLGADGGAVLKTALASLEKQLAGGKKEG